METHTQLLTLDELAEYLNLSRRTVYRLLKNTDIPAYRIGSHLRFIREEIDQWLQTRKVNERVG